MIRRMFDFLWGLIVTVYRLVVIIAILAALALIWLAMRGGAPVTVENNVALVLAPSGALVDQIDEDPSRRFLESFGGELPSQSSLRDLIDALEAAKDDERITFAVLKLDGVWDAGLAQLDELRTAMGDFQAAGKKIVAWGPWYDQMHYYAAAKADEIVLDPYGSVFVEGFSRYNNYFAEALEKIGVDVHVFRVGEYKSAVEPFTRNDMSEPARQANLEWLGDLWHSYGQAVSEGRGLAPGIADAYANGLADGLQANGGDAAAYARDQGLVTQLETLSQFRKRMSDIVGTDEDHGSFRQIHYLDYLSAVDHARRLASTATQKKVALVVVQGEIVDGVGEFGQAGGDTISDLLDDVRRDDTVAAVVLRINSPGGSVWAAEQIRRAVQNLRDDGKPVVASMSTLAASGGYWVAMDTAEIWAHDTTITGSIGVFGMIPTVDRTLQKLGVHTDGVGTTSLAGAFRIDRPLTPVAETIIQSGIEKIYRDFTEGVAAARKLPVAEVDRIARGRVWSGADAKQIGLIDKIGDLPQAADAAAQLAGLGPDDYVLDERVPDRGFANQLLSQFYGRIRIDLLPAGLSRWVETVSERSDVGALLSSFNDPRGYYAYCFCGVSNEHGR
jgi:protease-4